METVEQQCRRFSLHSVMQQKENEDLDYEINNAMLYTERAAVSDAA